MNFGCFYNPLENAPAGQIRGGFWDEDPKEDAAVKDNYCGGDDVWFTGHHYGAFNTEPRIASYLGIAAGQIPARHYYGTYRTFPNENCDWSWTETKAVGPGPSTRASASSRARCPTAACRSCRPGAAACSRR